MYWLSSMLTLHLFSLMLVWVSRYHHVANGMVQELIDESFCFNKYLPITTEPSKPLNDSIPTLLQEQT